MPRQSVHRPARLRRIMLALAVAAPVTPLMVLATPTVAVADVRPGFKAADTPLTRTVSFGYTGSEVGFTVPAGVTELDVVATGAPGGIFDPAHAQPTTSGRAARVTGTVSVTPGQLLRVRVGGAGKVPGSVLGGAGGWNGGGQGGSASPSSGSRGGAGGGGATDLRTCAQGAPGCDGLVARLMVAAGGGGAGSIYCGNCAESIGPVLGGNPGAAGGGYSGVRGEVTGGAPGTSAAGGAGGTAEYTPDRIADGSAGSFGTGAAGPSGEGLFGSGGGGGGWYGGGSGGNNRYYGAGGGGGSNLVPAGGSSELVTRSDAPGLSITYDAGMLEEVEVSLSDVPMIASGNDTRVVTATATTDTGLPYPGLDLSFSSTDPGQSFNNVVDRGDGTYTATLVGSTTAGTATITATAAGSVPSADVSGTAPVVTEDYAVSVSVDDDTPMIATGEDARVVTAAATSDGDRPLSGLDVSFSSTDEGQSFEDVTDNGDGTYSVTVLGSTTAGTATITATSAGSVASADVSGTTPVVTEGYEVSVSVDVDTPMIATGDDARTVTATAISESDVAVLDLDVSFSSTDDGQTVEDVTDNGDGTYSATLLGSTTAGTATVTATAAEGDVSGTISVVTEGYEVSVSVDDDTPMIATGEDARTVTATAATVDSDRPVRDLDVTFESTDAAQSFRNVTNNGDGTYSATLVGSTTDGTATVTATAAEGDVSGTTSVVTEGYEMSVSIDGDRPLVATGKDSRTVTATAATVDSDRPVRDLDVTFASTDAAQSFKNVTDNGDGTYSATLVGSTTAGPATVTATAAEGDVTGSKPIVTEGYTVTVRSTPSRLLATGQAVADVTAEARTAGGRAVPGLELRVTSTDRGHVIGPVADHGDGTYTARITGSTTVGAATLSAVVTGAGVPTVVPATLHTDPYTAPTLTASVTAAVPATGGWYRTPVTVSFACSGTLLTAACPGAVVLSTEGGAQTVNRSIADSIGRTAAATAGPISIDLTKPTVKVTGASKGKTYPRPRKLACQATDALSGVASCKVTTKKRAMKKKATRITWTAVASDKAGNTASTSGSYVVRPRRR